MTLWAQESKRGKPVQIVDLEKTTSSRALRVTVFFGGSKMGL